ncbi:MAG: C1 family peptidase, partial [Bacteroidales bacterium]|nr:C1 family peptidase [Bacteroidales bacterium]
AMVPDAQAKEGPGSDQAKWLNLSQTDRDKQANELKNPVPEMVITPEMRQEAFDNYQTTDDHGMHIYGIAKDQNGTKYYMVKNSWGEAGPYKGIWYVSQNFFKYKTLNFMIHKDAIPKKIAKKMGL